MRTIAEGVGKAPVETRAGIQKLVAFAFSGRVEFELIPDDEPTIDHTTLQNSGVPLVSLRVPFGEVNFKTFVHEATHAFILANLEGAMRNPTAASADEAATAAFVEEGRQFYDGKVAKNGTLVRDSVNLNALDGTFRATQEAAGAYAETLVLVDSEGRSTLAKAQNALARGGIKQAESLASTAESLLHRLDKPMGYVYPGGVVGIADKVLGEAEEDHLQEPAPDFVATYVEQVVFGGHLTRAGVEKELTDEIAAIRNRIREAGSE